LREGRVSTLADVTRAAPCFVWRSLRSRILRAYSANVVGELRNNLFEIHCETSTVNDWFDR